jgi:hypothetical protein
MGSIDITLHLFKDGDLAKTWMIANGATMAIGNCKQHANPDTCSISSDATAKTKNKVPAWKEFVSQG